MPQICHRHCPPEGGGAAGALLAVAVLAAVGAVVLFVVTHVLLVLGAAVVWAVGTIGTAIALRCHAAPLSVRTPQIAARLIAGGVPVRAVSVTQPQAALPPPVPWHVTSMEIVPERAVQGPAGGKIRP